MVYESLKDKVALVTGGTSGIGKAIAKHLLMNGANIIINYSNNDERASQALEELNQYGNVISFKADITIEEEVIGMFSEIDKYYNKLDYLINNAGIDIGAYIEDYKLEDFKKVIDVNLTGRFLCIQKAISLLKKSSSPRIINIASRLGTKPMEYSSAYCVSEAATIMLTKVSALELSKYNIRVNTVSPSLTLTPMSLQSYTKEEIEETAKKNPSKRLGELSDITNVVLFLLSSEADYINGENINVNGGILLV